MSASPIGPRPFAPATEHPASPAPGVSDSHAGRPGSAQQTDTVDARSTRAQSLVAALLNHVPPADRAAAKTAIPAILNAARASGETDPNRIGYLLATAQTESDFGAHMIETGHSRQWYDATYGGDDGNRPGTSDGYRFRGRGYVQTTHAGRYAELSHQLGLPDETGVDGGRSRTVPALVAHPDRLTEPALAARALVTGVRENLFTHNPAAAIDRTIPTGRPPGSCDFYHARGIVNGVVKDQALTIARHATAYAEILDGYRHSVLGTPAPK